MRNTTRLGTWTFVLPSVHGTTLANHRRTWFHCAYADDLQIYAHISPERSSDLVTRFSDCVEAVKSWMASNRLKLNPSKTEIIWLGSAGQLQRCLMTPLFITGAWITPSSRVRNFGGIIDGALTMGAHMDKLVGIYFFHLRQLRMVCRTLDVDAAHALVRALIHSRLDFCNSALAGLPARDVRPRGQKTWPRPRPRGLWPRPRGVWPRPRGFWPRASRPLEAYSRNGTECDWK